MQSTTATIASKVCRGSGEDAGKFSVRTVKTSWGISPETVLVPISIVSTSSVSDTLAAALTASATLVGIGSNFRAPDTLAPALAETAALTVGYRFTAADTVAAALAETATLTGTGNNFRISDTLAAAEAESGFLTITGPTDAVKTPLDCLAGPGGDPNSVGGSGGGLKNYVF